MKMTRRILAVLLLLSTLTLYGVAAQASGDLSHSYCAIDDAFEWDGKAYAIVKDWRNDYNGVIDESGNLVVECEYPNLFYAGEGLLMLRSPDYRGGYMDLNERPVTSFNWQETDYFFEGMATVSDGLYGFINADGELVVPCEWDAADRFESGFAAVQKNHKWGYIDKTGELVIPCEWDSHYTFSEDLLCVSKDGKMGYLDKTGRQVIPCEWDSASSFHQGLAAVYRDGKWGYIDKTGKLVIPCEWDLAGNFSDGLAKVSQGIEYIGDSDVYGYIDTTGKLVIPCEWEDASNFSEGLAAVKGDHGWGYIDQSGRQVVPCEWFTASDYVNGLGVVSTKDLRAMKEQYGVMDAAGNTIVPCEMTLYAFQIEYDDGFFIYRKPSGYGVYSASGEEIVLFKYDAIAYAADRFFLLKDEYLTVIDPQGNVLF